MRTTFRKSFERDLRKIKDTPVRKHIREVIEEVEAGANPEQIRHLKKISGARGYHRIRIGHYRTGIVIEGDTVDCTRPSSTRPVSIFPLTPHA